MDILLKDQIAEVRRDVRLHLRNIVGIVIRGEKHFERSPQGEWNEATDKVKNHHRLSYVRAWAELKRLQGRPRASY